MVKAFDHGPITITGFVILAENRAVRGHEIEMNDILLLIIALCNFSFMDVNLVLAALERSWVSNEAVWLSLRCCTSICLKCDSRTPVDISANTARVVSDG